MTVTFVSRLDGDLAEAAWKLYERTFQDLNALAVQRHLMYRSEFDSVVGDARVDKVLTCDVDGRLTGLTTYTRDLDAVPLISPAYFEGRWPQHYEQRRIWYIPFVAVDPDAQGSQAFTEVFAELYEVALRERGLVGMDICSYNELVRRLPYVIHRYLSHLSNYTSRFERLDAQTYWLYDMTGDTL